MNEIRAPAGIKEQLQDKLRELLDEAELEEEALVRGTGTNPDRSSLSQSYSARQINQAIHEKTVAMIEKIQSALERLEHGKYGICELCGEPISAARLAALPYAVTCIQCKSRMEKKLSGST